MDYLTLKDCIEYLKFNKKLLIKMTPTGERYKWNNKKIINLKHMHKKK